MSSFVYVSPGNDCRDALNELMDNAQYSLDICVFTISDNRLSQSIIDAHQRGVAVRIVTDNLKAEDRGSDVYQLAKEGVPLVIDNSPNHMHHKFMIVDGQRLANGSFNWTRSASERNQENVVVHDDPQLISEFDRMFNALWTAFKKI
ncbi:MAG: phospholipase D-like domain-containing protein [Pseudomonadota bacterium]